MKNKQSSSGLGDPALLDKIDKLFACNVGEHIDLPQLVVVGDQSSGKSSVLEGLTKLPFPRDSGLCTRFATQIMFRRSSDRSQKKSITVSIIPAPDADPTHKAQLREWSVHLETLDAASFSKIMSEVHTVMGLADPKGKREDSSKPTFSKDILRLEICGPDEDHLSVIDVPGIFRNTTPGLTTKADRDMVRDMVLSYMKNRRSVMLTVVAANVDMATQEIVEMARELDPDGERTLGVLTKPDLVDPGAEKKVMDIVEGKEQIMKLGWSIVRNLGQQELLDDIADRDITEEIFFRQTAPWNSLDKDKVGVQALRVRLREIIIANIRREFPAVRSEISKKLNARKNALQALGAERDTTKQQSSYLLNIMMAFQEITTEALRTNYGANDIFDEDEDLRLATVLVNRNETFSDDITQWGHEYSFTSAVDTAKIPGSIVKEEKGKEKKEVGKGGVSVRKKDNLPELEDILYDQETVPRSSDEDILSWIEKLYRNSRGFEIGTFDSSFLPTIMKRQTTKWTSFALGYISDVIVTVHNFIVRVLKSVCPDDRVRRNLLSVFMDDLVNKYKKAVEGVEFLLHVERTGTLMTLNHYLNDNLEKSRQERMRSSMAKKAVCDNRHGEVVRLSDIDHHHHDMSKIKHTVQDIHDILHAYYKVALKRFVDNVCMQATDYHLVTGPETPLKLFSPSLVSRLTAEQLEEIAGEDPALKRRRRQLKKEIEELEIGRKILL